MTGHDSGVSDSAPMNEAAIPVSPDAGVPVGDGASSEGATPSIDCTTIVACNLLTSDDVTRAMGMSLGTGMESDTPVSGGVHDYCFYGGMNGAPNVALNLECNPNAGFSPATLKQMVPSTATAVSGVGDAAYWDPAGDASDGPSDLYVVVGSEVVINISYTPGTTPVTVDLLTAAEAMATAVAGRL
jgi:hypothetical protein